MRFNADPQNLNEENLHFVEKGDIVKFGRVRFKIRELKIQGDGKESDDDAITHHINILEPNENGKRKLNDDTVTIEERN